MPLKEVQVSKVLIPIVLNNQVPHRISTHPVHPLWKRPLPTSQVHACIETLLVTENGADRACLGMHITQPDQTVALDTIPNILLHIEMHGVGPRHPDLIQPIVRTLERAQVRDIAIAEDSRGLLQVYHHIRVEKVETDKTEARATQLYLPIEWNSHHHVTDSMIIRCGIILQVNLSHTTSLGYRFTRVQFTTGL